MNRKSLCRALFFGAAFASLANTSHAQTALNDTPPVNAANVADLAPDSQAVQIKVKNVSSSLMAYWLDPRHQPTPIQIQQSETNAGAWAFEREPLPRQPGNSNGPLDLKLPPDVEIISSDDARNVLLVKGTPAGVAALRKLVAEIDVPINQIEVEAQFVQMSPQVLKTLPLKFAKNEDSSYMTSVALFPQGASLAAELNKLIAADKARVITAPRVIVKDGLAARIASVEMRALTLAPHENNSADMLKTDLQWLPGFSTVQLETGTVFMLVLRGDTIRLFTRSTLNDRNANVTANLRNGQTMAILMAADKSNTTTRTVIFVTARVIVRAGDEIVKKTSVGAAQIGMIQ